MTLTNHLVEHKWRKTRLHVCYDIIKEMLISINQL